ncbi:baseplate J/gp47 family protein [Methylobacterium iners]|uniref:Baseplate J-like central domain-containing protein n=1 Tax=Methylobacterium iners TaxID=418707 RepID=A0ABQ4RSK6_9HYPH|nr:baseplate J/gp47 family protein [Methylobacterium iners]GJD93340.1 hypothetical protein OCOJLMKI_0533 [Methylobacterium iners]
MTRFTDIVLARLPALPLGTDTFAAIKLARIAELEERLARYGFAFDVGMLETDPMVVANAEAGGVRELLALTRRDDGIRAVLLATSWGAFLDHLGATQVPAVARLPLVAEPRPFATNPEDWELDDDFRRRIQLAPETLSAAGPEGAYLGFTLATPGVKSASAYGPMSFGGTRENPFTPLGEVHVVIVAVEGDGSASPELIATVQAELRQEDRYPIADFIRVFAAEIVPYEIDAVIYVGGGADRALVEDVAGKNLLAQALRQHRPGAAQPQRMLYGQASVVGKDGANVVEDIDLAQPAADVNAEPITPGTRAAAYRAPFCTKITVKAEIGDE